VNIRHFLFTILSAVAEAERDRIRERIGTVKADQRARGCYLGGRVPYGFRVAADGQLEPIAEQQAVIARMVTLRTAGKSLRQIQASLDEHLSEDAISRICRDATAATDHSGAPAELAG
jgi:putative DNA-invertase from lambdoid prophage Rac